MQPHYNCVCGGDVHKEFLQVCVLRRDEDPESFRVFNNFSGIQELKQRVEEEGCECIVCESTGGYWYWLYLAFEGQIRIIVRNAYQIKNIPSRKTDVQDAQWIAELAMNGLINPPRRRGVRGHTEWVILVLHEPALDAVHARRLDERDLWRRSEEVEGWALLDRAECLDHRQHL